jgi:hypothetical protein
MNPIVQTPLIPKRKANPFNQQAEIPYSWRHRSETDTHKREEAGSGQIILQLTDSCHSEATED